MAQQMNQSEQALYTVYGSKSRALVPKIVSLFLLAFIFYLGVLINISLLELNASQETSLKTGALLTLALLIIIGTVLTFRKTQQPYLFYRNRVAHGKETIYYLNITNTMPQANFLDRAFKTYSIPLGKSFSLRYIPETTQKTQLSNYLQQLVDYARKNQ